MIQIPSPAGQLAEPNSGFDHADWLPPPQRSVLVAALSLSFLLHALAFFCVPRLPRATAPDESKRHGSLTVHLSDIGRDETAPGTRSAESVESATTQTVPVSAVPVPEPDRDPIDQTSPAANKHQPATAALESNSESSASDELRTDPQVPQLNIEQLRRDIVAAYLRQRIPEERPRELETPVIFKPNNDPQEESIRLANGQIRAKITSRSGKAYCFVMEERNPFDRFSIGATYQYPCPKSSK